MTTESRFSAAEALGLCLVVAACVALSAAGITWGLPSAERNALYFRTPESLKLHLAELKAEDVAESYKTWDNYRLLHPDEDVGRLPRSFYNPLRTYHPDEYIPLKMLSGLDPRKGRFDTRIYTLGGAYVYLLGAYLAAAHGLGFITLTQDLSVYFAHPELMARIYLAGRVLTLCFFAGTLVFVYLIARQIAGRYAALVAAALVGTTPLVVLNAHYMYVDIAAVFYAFAGFYFILRLFDGRNWRSYLLAGLLCGLAAGTKIQCLLLAVMIWLAHAGALRRAPKEERGRLGLWRLLADPKLLAAAGAFLAAFLITNPYALIKPYDFLFDIRRHAPHHFTLLLYAKALFVSMGPAAFLGALAALAASFWLKDRRNLLLGLWVILFIGFMSRYGHFFARFALPAVPALLTLLVTACAGLWRRSARLRPALAAFLTAAVVWNVLWDLSLADLLRGTDARTLAGRWIARNVPPGSSIGVVSVPWQYEMPPMDGRVYRIVVTNKDGEALRGERPEWFVASSPQFAWDVLDPDGPAYRNFWGRLFASGEYARVCSIDREQRLGPFRGFNASDFPEDLRRYVNPVVVVFKRTGPAYARETP